MTSEGGVSQSSRWEAYSSAMNCSLAEAANEATREELARGVSPILDWENFHQLQKGQTWDESIRPVNAAPMLAMSVAARHLGSDFSSTFCEACFDEQCFEAPREIDADSPTYRQAMSGPEHAEWEASNDREIDNIARHAAFEEVPEDTLPSWDPRTGKASEVISILRVLKKVHRWSF